MRINSFLSLLWLLVVPYWVVACSNVNTTSLVNAENPLATISVMNHSSAHYRNTPIYIPFRDLGIDDENLQLFGLFDGNQSHAYEIIDRNGDGDKDGLIALVSFKPKETVIWQLRKIGDKPPVYPIKRTQAEISVKQGGEWMIHPSVPNKQSYVGGEFKNVTNVTLPEFYTDHSNWIRYEGPGIESDKVGYRIYLDHRNGFDIFGKIQPEPVLQKIGQDGYQSYHSMLDWGMDILKVGSSLGAGGFGFWTGEKIIGVSDTQTRRARIIENGNLYSAFAIDYGQWQVNGERRDVSASFSMHAGSRLVHTRISMNNTLANLAIGVVKHPGTEFLQGVMENIHGYSYIGSWGQQSESGDHLGIAVIFKVKQFQKTIDEPTSYVALMAPEKGAIDSTLEYYFVAAWQGEHGHGIDSKSAFVRYLENEIVTLSQPPSVNVVRHAANY